MPEPADSVTPPARKTRPKKLRSGSGISRTYSLVTSVPRVALPVSRSGDSVVTVTDSVIAPGDIVKSAVACWLTARTTPLRSRGAIPGLSARMV